MVGGLNMDNKSCEHKWVHMDTKKRSHSESYIIYYKRIDYFFCEKCLETKEIVRDDYSREMPDWYYKKGDY
jgi:hypothetical protein